MPSSLDIFKIDPGGRVLWRGAVESFVAAKARIQKLALSSVSSPGEYLILDQDTGQRVLVMLLTVSPQTTPATKRPVNVRSVARPSLQHAKPGKPLDTSVWSHGPSLAIANRPSRCGKCCHES